MAIQQDAQKLLDKIRRERKTLGIPEGQPVPVVIEINRLPCNHCVDNLLDAFGAFRSEVSVTVHAASVWQKGYGTIPLTSNEQLRKLIDGGIEVKPFHIWPLLVKKLKSFGQPEMLVGNRVYAINEWLNLNAGTYGEGAFGVQEMVDEANSLKVIHSRRTPRERESNSRHGLPSDRHRGCRGYRSRASSEDDESWD